MPLLLLLSLQQTAATSRYLIPGFCIRTSNIVRVNKKTNSNDDRKLINQTPLIFALAIDGSLRMRARRGFIINSHVYTVERLATVQTGAV